MSDKPPTYDDIPLRGTYYCGGFAIKCARSLVEGDGLYNMRERNNQHDSNAIIIHHEQTKLGYVGKEYAAVIAPWMDQGWQFMCTVQENYVCRVPTHVHITLRLTPLGRPRKATTVEKKKELEYDQ